MPDRPRPSDVPFARHGWVGLLLVGLCWPLNWLLPGLRTHLLFFPLWLGYILCVDALVLRRRGTSLLTRSRRDFGLLFVISAPAWWLFEVVNWRTQNWVYLGREHFSDLAYFLLASVAFSTVMPAVFETAELVRSFGWVARMRRGTALHPTPRFARALFATGLLLLAILLLWPVYFYPYVWAALFCLLEPFNMRRRHPSLFDDLRVGDWRPVVSLALGALLCGFFWELWNYHAYPKWTYRTPGVEFWYVFEMPLLGYIGYPPFALELYALLHLFGRRFSVHLGPAPDPLNLR